MLLPSWISSCGSGKNGLGARVFVCCSAHSLRARVKWQLTYNVLTQICDVAASMFQIETKFIAISNCMRRFHRNCKFANPASCLKNLKES